MDADFQHCAALVREADRDRYLAALFAPADRRNALFSLYAFDLEIARVRDVAREPMPGEIRLQWWREVLEGKRDTEAAAHPVAAAFLETLTQYHLPRAPLIDLIEARSFDLYDDPMSSFAELQGYARQTAGTIVEDAARVLAGDLNAAVVDLAHAAGEALTLAAVLTKLPLHTARGQLYLPLETLSAYAAKHEDIFARKATTELRTALAELRLRARSHLSRIGEAATEIPPRVWPAFLPLAPLRPLLLRMERRDYDPFQPPQMAPWRRQWRIWRAAGDLGRIGR